MTIKSCNCIYIEQACVIMSGYRWSEGISAGTDMFQFLGDPVVHYEPYIAFSVVTQQHNVQNCRFQSCANKCALYDNKKLQLHLYSPRFNSLCSSPSPHLSCRTIRHFLTDKDTWVASLFDEQRHTGCISF